MDFQDRQSCKVGYLIKSIKILFKCSKYLYLKSNTQIIFSLFISYFNFNHITKIVNIFFTVNSHNSTKKTDKYFHKYTKLYGVKCSIKLM